MLHPATPIYEVLIGSILFASVFATVFSIPLIYAIYHDAKEQKLRINVDSTEKTDNIDYDGMGNYGRFPMSKNGRRK